MCVLGHWVGDGEQRTQGKVIVVHSCLPQTESVQEQRCVCDWCPARCHTHLMHTPCSGGHQPRRLPHRPLPQSSLGPSSPQQLSCSQWGLQRKERLSLLLEEADYRAGTGRGLDKEAWGPAAGEGRGGWGQGVHRPDTESRAPGASPLLSWPWALLGPTS